MKLKDLCNIKFEKPDRTLLSKRDRPLTFIGVCCLYLAILWRQGRHRVVFKSAYS